MQSLPGDKVKDRVAEMLDLVGLTGYEKRRVYDLSGGEQQRVALARSLAPGPRLLMLDEPLGSLDRALREELMNELRAILKEVGVTALYVTHDQEEAFAIGDRVVIMRRGRIVQQGRPQAVYHQPASPWVARFLGLSNLIPGRVVALDPLRVDTALGPLLFPQGKTGESGQDVVLLIRPEAARLAASRSAAAPPAGDEPSEGEIDLEVTVVDCSFRGGHCRLVVQYEAGPELAFELSSGLAPLPQPGEAISLALRAAAIDLLPAGD
jgi:ABC-type Fe3+/spermidine/putrescine transport system ATPase subunit